MIIEIDEVFGRSSKIDKKIRLNFDDIESNLNL